MLRRCSRCSTPARSCRPTSSALARGAYQPRCSVPRCRARFPGEAAAFLGSLWRAPHGGGGRYHARAHAPPQTTAAPATQPLHNKSVILRRRSRCVASSHPLSEGHGAGQWQLAPRRVDVMLPDTSSISNTRPPLLASAAPGTVSARARLVRRASVASAPAPAVFLAALVVFLREHARGLEISLTPALLRIRHVIPPSTISN